MAQIIALTRHGNAVLRGDDAGSFDQNITAVGRIGFAAVVKTIFGKRKLKKVAGHADDWVHALKAKGCTGLRLHGDDGDWAIEALMPDNISQMWMPRWDAEPHATYGLLATGPTQPWTGPTPEQARAAVEQALIAIHAYAEKNNADPFTRHFADALDTLRSGGPDALHDACHTAWVFGGMGSWNDLGLGGEEFDRVSRQLHDALVDGFIASAN